MTKRILLIISILAAITSGSAISVLAGDKYIQYDLNKLSKKASDRLKAINEKLKIMEKEENIKMKLEEIDSIYERAETFYNEGNFDEAKQLYKKLDEYSKEPLVKKAASQRKREMRKLEKKTKTAEREARIKSMREIKCAMSDAL